MIDMTSFMSKDGPRFHGYRDWHSSGCRGLSEMGPRYRLPLAVRGSVITFYEWSVTTRGKITQPPSHSFGNA